MENQILKQINLTLKDVANNKINKNDALDKIKIFYHLNKQTENGKKRFIKNEIYNLKKVLFKL